MNYPTAIVVAAALIAGAIVFGDTIPEVQAQRTGPWQISTSTGLLVYRVNTASGEMEVCATAGLMSLTPLRFEEQPAECQAMPPPGVASAAIMLRRMDAIERQAAPPPAR